LRSEAGHFDRRVRRIACSLSGSAIPTQLHDGADAKGPRRSPHDSVDDDTSVGAVILRGVPKRYITHFDIAEILAAASYVARPLSGEALLNLLLDIDVAGGGVSGGDRPWSELPSVNSLSVPRFNQAVLRIMRSPAVHRRHRGPAAVQDWRCRSASTSALAADDEFVGFILPELLIGLTTTVGGQRLAQLIGPAKALEMMLEGRMYSHRRQIAWAW
jgi:enoyl-CoA hydratase/carnithine racemase